MNTKTQTITTEGYPEAGPFETQSEAMGAFVLPLGQVVLSVEHRKDGWYRTYMVNSTTSVWYWLEGRSRTRTKTAAWPGPFTEAEAQRYANALLASDNSIMTTHVIQEDDGWYVGYAYKITTTLRQETKKLDIGCLRRAFDTLMGRMRRKENNHA